VFTIIDDPEFTEAVPVEVPAGAEWRRETLVTRFRALRLSDLDALDEAGGDTVTRLLDRVVVGFDDLVDESGARLDGYSEWRARLLDYPFIRTALTQAYYRALMGARAGNSAPSAGPGPKAA